MIELFGLVKWGYFIYALCKVYPELYVLAEHLDMTNAIVNSNEARASSDSIVWWGGDFCLNGHSRVCGDSRVWWGYNAEIATVYYAQAWNHLVNLAILQGVLFPESTTTVVDFWSHGYYSVIIFSSGRVVGSGVFVFPFWI